MNQLGDVGTTFNSVQVISVFIGIGLPLLVAFVTKRFETHPAVKTVILLILSAVTSLVTVWQADPSHFNIVAVLLTWLATFSSAVISYKGAWSSFDWFKTIQESIGAKDSPQTLRKAKAIESGGAQPGNPQKAS